MVVVKAPNSFSLLKPTIFLAGSIEMGKAVDWQTELTNNLSHLDITILNPRRDYWDSSWEQTIKNEKFNEQVRWELTALEQASLVVMYFDPATKSPVSLLELGLFAKTGKLLVCCPEGFWRKGNVDIVCEMYNITQVKNLSEMQYRIVERIK